MTDRVLVVGAVPLLDVVLYTPRLVELGGVVVVEFVVGAVPMLDVVL